MKFDYVWNYQTLKYETKLVPESPKFPPPYIPYSSIPTGPNISNLIGTCISACHENKTSRLFCVLCFGDGSDSPCWFWVNVVAQPVFDLIGFILLLDTAVINHPAERTAGIVFFGMSGAMVAINIGLAIFKCCTSPAEEKTPLQQNRENASAIV